MIAAAGDDPRFGTGYAIAAYVVIFVALFGYVGWLHLSHARLRRRLDALSRALAERSPPAGR